MAYVMDLAAIVISAMLSMLPAIVSSSAVVQQEPDTTRRTLRFPGSDGPGRMLEVSNVNGRVRIIAEDRQDVGIVAVRPAGEAAAQASDSPGPDFREESDRILVCGDAEQCGCHQDARSRRRSRDGADRRVDLELRVPRQVALDVCAVSGQVVVEGVEGRYELRTVSGSVTMTDVRGSGLVRTVNGAIDASFIEPPATASGFKTVNGRIEVRFPGTLSADLRLRTLNGELLTDFETTRMASAPMQEQRGARRVYRANRYTAVRVGQGGPELTFETVNGDVRIRRR
ncbi:MAG: DUF4097 domain-containing protein [Vicinamibacterales bacterium]